MADKTWHYRLDQALTARGKTWKDLADHLEKHITKTSVYSWKPEAAKRTEMMEGRHAARVCDYLKIRPLWLFHKEGPSGLSASMEQTTDTGQPKIQLSPYELILSGLDALVIVGRAQEEIIKAIEKEEEQARMTVAAVIDNSAGKTQPTSSKAVTTPRRRRVYYDEDVNRTPLNDKRSVRHAKRRKGDQDA